MEDSPISRAIRRMARKACGLPEVEAKKSGFGLFGWASRGLNKMRPGDSDADEEERALGSSPA
jgi:hypothetical protein